MKAAIQLTMLGLLVLPGEAGLRVSHEMKAPLLCVTDVFKVASGDLSLPGSVDAP